MTFKIGDRVHLPFSGENGVVTEVAVGEIRVRMDGGRIADLFPWAVEAVKPAYGPRPLPIRQRVVLTAGKTLRQPSRAAWTQVHSLHSPRTSDGVRSWFV